MSDSFFILFFKQIKMMQNLYDNFFICVQKGRIWERTELQNVSAKRTYLLTSLLH